MNCLFEFEHAINTVKWTHHVRDKLDSVVVDETFYSVSCHGRDRVSEI